MQILQDRIKAILVINLGGIGDILLATPALRALRRLYPKAYIALLTVSRSYVLGKDLSYVDEVIIYRGLKGLLNLRKKRFDMLINMRTLTSIFSALKMSLLFMIIGARYKIGRDTEKRGFFLNVKIPEEDIATMHDVVYNLKIIESLGGETEDKSIYLGVSEEDESFIKDYLLKNGVNDSDILIGVNPGATWPSKRWPIENFAEVIKELSPRGYKIIVIGSRQEFSLAHRLGELTSVKLLVVTGKTSFGQIVALIKRLHLLITNDGGLMHIASILETPLIAILGPTDPIRFRPYRDSPKTIVMYKKVNCAPCFRRNCNSGKCLKAIKPEEVVEVALGMV